MTTSDGRPLDGEEIAALVREVADDLPDDGRRRSIIVVGGSLLSWHGLRQTTLDVDSIRRIDETLRASVRTVAERHGLDPSWLNDRAAPWMPATFDERRCDTLLDHARLLVLGAPLSDVFLMKVDRADPQDIDDLVRIWPSIVETFPTATSVVAAHRSAFPASPDDPHLGGFIEEIAVRAGLPFPEN